MSTIKVVHETVTRRFTLSPNSTFSNLESQLRNLFLIPTSIPITVSYTDEDGDVITISSDLELEEIISQQSTGHSIKIFLNTPTGYTRRIDSNKDMEEISETQPKPKLRPSSTYKHVGFAGEEEEERLYEFVTDENSKEPEKQDSSESNVKGQEKEKECEDDSDKSHVIFIKFTHPPSYSHHFGPRFDLFNTLEFEPFGLDQFPFGHTLGGYRNYRNCEAMKNRRSNKNSCGYTSSPGFNKPTGYNRAGSCSQANSYGPRAERQGFRGYHHFDQQLTSEQLADKLKTLNSMGFVFDNAKYEDLLKRYNGHVGRVVDILLREREESDQASSSKSENQSSNENEQETSQYFIPVMEVDPENRPYSL